MTNTHDTEYTVHIPDELKKQLGEIFSDADSAIDSEDTGENTVEEISQRFAHNIDSGKPLLKAPLGPPEIKQLTNTELRALAWDLDAIATAYNYASDPVLPDLARDPPRTWVNNNERALLELACILLQTTYTKLHARVENEFPEFNNTTTESPAVVNVETGTVYAHEEYGDVLVTSIHQPYTSYDTTQDEGDADPVVVNYTTEWDGYGPMFGHTTTERLHEFVTGIIETKESPDFHSPADDSS